MSQRPVSRATTFVWTLAASALFIPAILLLDGPASLRQALLGVATALFLALFVRLNELEVLPIACAILVATTGECVLSIGWGLYRYRDAFIPFYVPFGHGLFYALAASTAAREVSRRNAARITVAVLLLGACGALISLALLRDVWGMLWFGVAAALIVRSRSSALLPICFVYTMLLELLGTALGNWRWESVVPGLGIHSANPPSGVGLLYVLLDFITVAVCARLGTWRRAIEETS